MSKPAVSGTFSELFVPDGENNRICEAIVFSGQAHLTRSVLSRSQKGLNRILIEVGGVSIDRDSVHAIVLGVGKTISVQYKEVPVLNPPQDDIHALNQQKKETERALRNLQLEKEVQDKQTNFLDSFVTFSQTEIPKKVQTQFPKPDEIQSTLEFLGSNFKTISEETARLDNCIEDKGEELKVLDKRLKNIVMPKEPTRKTIEIFFNADKDQDIEIKASYVSLNAFWKPIYHVMVAKDFSSPTITLFAQIWQKTGEHWNGTKLSVSNAVPLRGSSLPDLQSWHLSVFLPPSAGSAPVGSSGGQKMFAAQALSEDFSEIGAMDDLEADAESFEDVSGAEFVQAQEKKLPLAFEYEIIHPASIGSGDGETLVPLSTKPVKGEFFVLSVPQKDPYSYLVCNAKADEALLPGRLNIYFDNRFVGGTTLEEKQPGEDLFLNLGVDRGVKVSRVKKTDKFIETFLGVIERSDKVREFEYRIVVENLKAEEATIHLIDTVPVSQTDRIQVKGMDISPEPVTKEYKGREGVLLWEFSLAPQEVKEIHIKFCIKYPKDVTIQGI